MLSTKVISRVPRKLSVVPEWSHDSNDVVYANIEVYLEAPISVILY